MPESPEPGLAGGELSHGGFSPAGRPPGGPAQPEFTATVPPQPEPTGRPTAPEPAGRPAQPEPRGRHAKSRQGTGVDTEELLRLQANATRERGDLGESAAIWMRLGVWLEQRDRGIDAAEAFASAAAIFNERGDRFSAVRAYAIQASNLYAAGSRDEALRILADTDQIVKQLPDRELGLPPADRGEAEEMQLAAEARAVLNVHAAFILGREGRYQEAIRRSYTAIGGFRATYQQDEADRAAILAGQVIVAAGGPIAARQALRELLTGLAPGGEAHTQVGRMLADVERSLNEGS